MADGEPCLTILNNEDLETLASIKPKVPMNTVESNQRRDSLLKKLDPLLSADTETDPTSEPTSEPQEDIVKNGPIHFDLVEVKTNLVQQLETLDPASTDQVDTEASNGDAEDGQPKHDETFVLTDDGTAAETWYSLDVDVNHIPTDQIQLENPEKENQLLKDRIAELESNLNDDALMVANYEQKLCAMTDDAENWKARAMALDRDKIALIRERDQAREDLHNVESAFSDVHSKYERVKEVLKNNNLNQELLESRDIELQDRLRSAHAHIAELEEEFKEKLTSVYSSFEARLKNQDLDTTRLRAQLRKLQMKNETLENEVKQKSSEIAKLSSLCDELINKV